RFLELGREVENNPAKDVDAGVVPADFARLEPAVAFELLDLNWSWFFDEANQAEIFVEEIQTAFSHVFTAGDRNQAGEFTRMKPRQHLRIRVGLNEDVAISEQKWIAAHKVFGQFRGFAGAILDHLPSISDVHAELPAIFEVLLDRFRAIPGDDKNIANPVLGEALDDVLQNRFALDFEHRFRKLVRQFAHPGALSGRP